MNLHFLLLVTLYPVLGKKEKIMQENVYYFIRVIKKQSFDFRKNLKKNKQNL